MSPRAIASTRSLTLFTPNTSSAGNCGLYRSGNGPKTDPLAAQFSIVSHRFAQFRASRTLYGERLQRIPFLHGGKREPLSRCDGMGKLVDDDGPPSGSTATSTSNSTRVAKQENHNISPCECSVLTMDPLDQATLFARCFLEPADY
ncbi:unnamed protein product [Hyaloperonospora brassicae]|uniref:RxLR effector candidate protein n=1 Tax=Hyaloperonospora brassicae TaxID=162125 RepID=A0AAV0V1C5_HYABA|nr:unnamed protein product [Hyaloperonospora brassicae]